MAEKTERLVGRVSDLIQDEVGATSHDAEECAYNVVAEVVRGLAANLDAEIHEWTHPPVPGMTPDFADGYRTAIESVREWCGVQQEEERNG